MIKNEKQYQITQSKLNQFENLKTTIENSKSLDEITKELNLSAISSQIEEFKEDLLYYEDLKNGNINRIEIRTIEEISEVLIKARISKGWTQAELALNLEMQEQQIQRYEATNYSSASLTKIKTIREALGLKSNTISFNLENLSFLTPKGMNSEKLHQAQNLLSSRKSLLISA